MTLQKVNPFYVECGANDGEFSSNSIWLEQHLKWDGILIEGDPDTFNQLATKNRKAWTGKFCLSNARQAKIVSGCIQILIIAQITIFAKKYEKLLLPLLP